MKLIKIRDSLRGNPMYVCKITQLLDCMQSCETEDFSFMTRYYYWIEPGSNKNEYNLCCKSFVDNLGIVVGIIHISDTDTITSIDIFNKNIKNNKEFMSKFIGQTLSATVRILTVTDVNLIAVDGKIYECMDFENGTNFIHLQVTLDRYEDLLYDNHVPLLGYHINPFEGSIGAVSRISHPRITRILPHQYQEQYRLYEIDIPESQCIELNTGKLSELIMDITWVPGNCPNSHELYQPFQGDSIYPTVYAFPYIDTKYIINHTTIGAVI